MEQDSDIYDAVEFGDLKSVKLYWNKSIDVDYQDLNGMTLLMFASSYGFEDIVEFLLTMNPKIDLKNIKGMTALEIAKEKRNENIFKILMNRMKDMK